jgi:hypothetical protein
MDLAIRQLNFYPPSIFSEECADAYPTRALVRIRVWPKNFNELKAARPAFFFLLSPPNFEG